MEQPTVSRLYRTATKIGEDFVTIEEVITLPIGASDADIRQAADLGWRIYHAQSEAAQKQLERVRFGHAPLQPADAPMRNPDAPATEKQRNYIARLQDDLAWTNEQLISYADECSVDLVQMSKAGASNFIDGMKRLLDEPVVKQATRNQPRPARDEPPPPEPNDDNGHIPF